MPDRIAVTAPAKVNLSLRVGAPDSGGMHPLYSLAQSVSWHDVLTFEESDDDAFEVVGADLPEDEENLAWRAVVALREAGARQIPVRLSLVKRLPVAAGIAGGSADAAAALTGYAHLSGYAGDLTEIGADLGADVPFCLVGGTRWLEGYGERLAPASVDGLDYHLVLATPPFALATPAVYHMWDRLSAPTGPEVSGRVLPPSLRPHAPLLNDLYPAAVACNPELDDWRRELQRLWDRPVLMSGSGPTLFSFFGDDGEAQEAWQLVPSAARASAAAQPIDRGATLRDR